MLRWLVPIALLAACGAGTARDNPATSVGFTTAPLPRLESEPDRSPDAEPEPEDPATVIEPDPAPLTPPVTPEWAELAEGEALRGTRVSLTGRVYNVQRAGDRQVVQMLLEPCPSGERCALWVSASNATQVAQHDWARVTGPVGEPRSFPSATGRVVSVPRVDADAVVVLSDPHPLVAGLARELRAFGGDRVERALARIDVSGTQLGDDEALRERLSYRLFRELAGAALGRGGRITAEVARQVRRLPREASDDAMDLAAVVHMDLESVGNRIGIAIDDCAARGGDHEASLVRCTGQLARTTAATRVGYLALMPVVDAETMTLEGGSTVEGDGCCELPDAPFSQLLSRAIDAGVPGARIRRVLLDAIAELAQAARRRD